MVLQLKYGVEYSNRILAQNRRRTCIREVMRSLGVISFSFWRYIGPHNGNSVVVRIVARDVLLSVLASIQLKTTSSIGKFEKISYTVA